MDGNREPIRLSTSINSAHVSLKVKKMDDIEEFICSKFVAFLSRRAEAFLFLRKAPVHVSMPEGLLRDTI